MNYPGLFVLTLFLLGSDAVYASEFHASLPGFCKAEAEKTLPGIIQLFSADPNLIRNAGARVPAEIEKLRYDFSKSIPLYDIDYDTLNTAASFADVIVSTNSWSIPMCLADLCQVIAIVSCDEKTQKAAVLYAGRDLQARRFQDSEQRLKDLGGPELNGARIISSDTLDFVFVPGKDPSTSFLIPASADMSSDLYQQMGPEVFDQNPGTAKADRIDIIAFKKMVAKRDELYRSAADQEISATDIPDSQGFSENGDGPGGPENQSVGGHTEGQPFQATVLDVDGALGADPADNLSPKGVDGAIGPDDEAVWSDFSLKASIFGALVLLAIGSLGLMVFRKFAVAKRS